MCKTMELIDVMHGRKIDVVHLHETKWRWRKAKDLKEVYKLLYSSANMTRNLVEIVWKMKC